MGQVYVPGSAGSGGDPNASYLLAGLSATLANDRVLTAGANIAFVDGGPGAAFTISASAGGAPVNATYVCIALDATLTNERALAVGAGLQLVDGGANANVTLSVPANGITDALVRQSAGVSVIGRAANSVGNVADIAAAANGDVLRMEGGALGFGAIPEASVTNLVADLAALTASVASKQTNIQFEDEGANLGASGTVTEVDFTGAGVTASRAANKVTVNVSGAAGAFTATAVTINMPYPAKTTQRVNVVDAAVTATSKIVPVVAGVAETAINTSDFNDLESLVGFPLAGSIDFILSFIRPNAGPLAINYAVSA